MNRPSSTPPLDCTTCELEIAGQAEFLAGLPFCCAGCVVGGPCVCSYDLLDEKTAEVKTTGAAAEPALVGMSHQ